MPIEPDKGGLVVVASAENNVLARRTAKCKQSKIDRCHDYLPFCSVLCHELDGQPSPTIAED